MRGSKQKPAYFRLHMAGGITRLLPHAPKRKCIYLYVRNTCRARPVGRGFQNVSGGYPSLLFFFVLPFLLFVMLPSLYYSRSLFPSYPVSLLFVPFLLCLLCLCHRCSCPALFPSCVLPLFFLCHSPVAKFPLCLHTFFLCLPSYLSSYVSITLSIHSSRIPFLKRGGV